jgi:hypothetical protein
MNHSWPVPLYVDCRGLTTSPMAQAGRLFEIRFVFIDQRLVVDTSAGLSARLELKPRSVADFHAVLFRELEPLGLDVAILSTPCEIAGIVLRSRGVQVARESRGAMLPPCRQTPPLTGLLVWTEAIHSQAQPSAASPRRWISRA